MTGEMVLAIVVAIVGSSGLWGFLQWMLETKCKKRNQTLKDMDKKLDKLATKSEISAISDELVLIKNVLDTDRDLTLSMAREKLNEMSNRYLALGYIPYEEYVAYNSIGEAYIRAGGNSDIKAKFELVMEDLDVKPAKE